MKTQIPASAAAGKPAPRGFLLLTAACGLLACGDAGVLRPDLPEGCGRPLACQVEGPDLAVLPPVILHDAAQRDPVTGWPVFMPGDSFAYTFTVVNRGTVTTRPDTVSGTIPVPALQPGELFTDTVMMQAYTELNLQIDSLRVHVSLSGRQGDDPLLANDAAESDPYFIALPVLRATLQVPDTARELQPFVGTFTVTNHSRFAAMPPSRMVLCLFDYDVGCGSWAGAPFHLTDVPSIPAGGSWTTTDTIVIPPIDDRYYADWPWELVACFGDADATLQDLLDWQRRTCVRESRPLHVRPALEGGAP